MLELLPRRLLRLEGLAVLVAALALYFDSGHGWLLLVVLFLAPDLSLLGFLGGPGLGAATYDVVHTYALPLGLGVVGVLAGAELASQLALVWIAHIGMDRAVGYGLKYPAGFKDTHLQRV
ncbi:MAG TPA: DUF4260 family protein [Gaiellaceae bacterium]|nr:DUF4260 family protein [Gaiellaceae bacterium]